MAFTTFESAVHLERHGDIDSDLERTRTAGGHLEDRSQPALPVFHRRLANPAPLAVLSLATSIFLICSFGLNARGVKSPNIMVGTLIFFGGICQFIAGIMEFVSGNTFGATVFPSYGALNMAYAMIYLPGSGILAAYTDKATGELDATFPQAVAIFLWSWFMLSVAYTIAAVRSSWILLADFVLIDIFFMLLACGQMLENISIEKAGYCVGFLVVFFSYWVGVAGLYAGDTTPFHVPVFPLNKER